MFDEAALCIQLPAIVKAVGEDRKISVEASNQYLDSEGDVILQAGLMWSAESFIKTGHLDIDHYSEIGDRIPNLPLPPTEYIIGVPTAVEDLGDYRTGVTGQLHKAGRKKADEVWESLKADPPVRWQASIYGFPVPGQVLDARVSKTQDMMGATRYLVRQLDWRSLALTRNPINTAIKGSARIVTAKAFLAFMKSRMPGIADGLEKAEERGLLQPADHILPPRNREELMGHYHYHMGKGRCPCAGPNAASVFTFRQHFMKCCGDSHWDADVKANALMNLLARDKSSR